MVADCEDASLLVSPAAALDGGGAAPLAVSGVELRGDAISAEVDGQRLSASWCLHRWGLAPPCAARARMHVVCPDGWAKQASAPRRRSYLPARLRINSHPQHNPQHNNAIHSGMQPRGRGGA